jgi:hypothetical protein
MRPISIRCSWGVHKFTEVDDCNRVTCERCGERKPVRFAQIQPAEDIGRVLNRPRTKGQR